LIEEVNSSVADEAAVTKPPMANPEVRVPAPVKRRLAVDIEVEVVQIFPSYSSVDAVLTVVSPPNANPAV
jgi:hypothetical protein